MERKGGELAKRAMVKEKQGSAEGVQKYGVQEDWRQEEMRRFKQQMKKDQNGQAHEQGQREGRNQVYSQPGTPVRDQPDYVEDEELRRALELSCQEAEKDDPDLAFALAVSMEEYRVQSHVPKIASRRSSEEDLQEALKRSCLETGHEQGQKGREIGKDKRNSQAEPRDMFKPQETALHTTSPRVKTGEIRGPQEEGSPYTTNRIQSKLPGAAREEARKYQSCYTKDAPRDENNGSRRVATLEEEKKSTEGRPKAMGKIKSNPGWPSQRQG